MAEAILLDDASAQQGSAGLGLTVAIAWRNLWRNRRRTWLTVAGISFAIFLVAVGMAFQQGSYSNMIDNATGLFMGQIQLSAQEYVDDQRLEHTLPNATQLAAALEAKGLAVAPRVQGFALVSVGERSFGGLTIGVDFAAEQQVVNFFDKVSEGSLPQAADGVLVGEILARNLGAAVGDELVVLGTGKEGGVAALALNISGLFRSGQSELDRTLLFAPLQTVQEGFFLEDEVHQFVIRARDISALEPAQQAARQAVAEVGVSTPAAVRTWPEFLPELTQSIELDRISARIMYGAILVLVTFSVVNTFLMVVFERTREFGMLLALGMRPSAIISQVLLEALFMWVLGAAIGLGLSLLLVGYFATVGVQMPGMEELAAQYYMSDRLYPGFSVALFTTAPLILLVGTQLAALLATWRVRRISPVVALRAG